MSHMEQAATHVSPSETPPVIDRDHLRTMTSSDIDLAQEVIDIFRHQAEIWSRMLDPAASPRHWADAAHSLKGAALSLGANQLAKSCGAAETLGRRETVPSKAEAAVALSQVKDDLGHALEAAAHLGHQLARTGKF